MNKLSSAAPLTGSLSLLCCLSLSLTPLQAQNTGPAPSMAPYGQNQGQNQQGFAPVRLSPEALDQLVAPIALYPDALIALMLPASTVPSDVVLAERYLAGGGDPAQAENQSWDESVKALLHYPDVLAWMDQNLDWTTSLGEAFATQSADVMNAIQVMRAQARAAGNLIDTPQQTVVVERDVVRILPADPEIIYVPVYDPEVVYVQPYSPDYGSLISFGVGCTVGAWLSYDFDWGHRSFYHGNWNGWHNGWNNGQHAGGNTTVVNVINISNNGATAWQPSANSVRQISQRQHNNGGNARIATAAPVQPGGSAQSAAHHPGVIPHPNRIHLSAGTAPARQTGAGATAPITTIPTTTAPTQHFQPHPPTHQVSQLQQPVNNQIPNTTPLGQQVTPTQPTSTIPPNQSIQSTPLPTPHTKPPQLHHLQQQPQVQEAQHQTLPASQAIPHTSPPELQQIQQPQQAQQTQKRESVPPTQSEHRQAAPEFQQQHAEPIHQQAVPEHHAAPPAESHPRESAPQVMQAPKAAPPQQHIAPAPAPAAPAAAAQEPKEHKKGEDKDKKTP